MSDSRDEINHLLAGPLVAGDAPWPLALTVRLCDLRPRFLDKGRAGHGYRAIARNGRVLLASDRPLAELPGRVARARLQTWHRAILPGEPARPYGVLLSLRCGHRHAEEPIYTARLVRDPEEGFALTLDVGGGLVLELLLPKKPDMTNAWC